MNTAPLLKNIEHLKGHPDRNAAYTAGVIAEWIKVIDQAMFDNEMEIEMLAGKVAFNEDRTDLFAKLLVITGNTDKLVAMQILGVEKFDRAVGFLFDAKDKINHRNIYAIATLLDLAEQEGKKITTLQELVNYANGH